MTRGFHARRNGASLSRVLGCLAIPLVCLTLACTAAPAPSSAPAAPPAVPPGAPAAASAAPTPSAPAASAASRPAAQPLSPPEPVRVATIGIAAEAPIFLAYEQGYFRELGLEVEFVRLASGSDSAAALNSGQLDVGGLTINPGEFNVLARGVGMRLVADRGSNIPGRATPSLAIRADVLERTPWTGYQGLRGLKLVTADVVGIGDIWLERMLQRGGLQLDDVENLSPMTFPDMALAFTNKAIDAALFNEPWATQLEQQGIVKKVVYADDVDPNGHVAAAVFGEAFARNTPAARNYLVGWLRGVRDYWDAYGGRKDFQVIVDVLQKYTAVKDEALIRKIPPTGQSPTGYLDVEMLSRYQDWFAERGVVPRKAGVARAYDRSFADYANAVLGPYEPVATPRRPS
jgi:ABC-type nitrate/sulfonate/bicarbonate transport system substrate-binding protein